jgi:hypothetical protein
MKEKDKELSKKEKLEQENFLLESKIILKGGDIHRCSDIDPVQSVTQMSRRSWYIL